MKKHFFTLCFISMFTAQLSAQNTFQRNFKGKTGIVHTIVTKANKGQFLYAGIVNKQTTTFLFASLLDKNGNTVWQKYFTDSVNKPGKVIAAQTADGGFIIAASEYYTNKFSLLKLNASGNLLWSKIYSGFQNFTAYGITNAYDGSITVAGGTITQGFIININQTNGAVVWMKTLSTNLTNVYDGAEVFRSIVKTKDDGYILGGIAGNYGSDMLMAKYNNNGACVWTKIISSSLAGGSESINSAVEALDGGYVFSGNTRSNVSTGVEDVSAVKTDINGNIIWSKQFDNGNFETAWDMIRTSDSAFVLMSSNSLTKINKSGSIQWLETTLAGASPYYNFNSILRTNDDGFIATQENSYSNRDSALTIKFDSNGNTCSGIISSNPAAINMPYTQYSYTIDTANVTAQLQVSAGVYKKVSGKTSNSILCESSFAQNTSQQEARITSLNSVKPLTVKISPNPVANNILNISINCSRTGKAQLTILNMDGRTVLSQTITLVTGAANKTINISSLSKGLYILKLSDGKEQQTIKFVKK